MWGSEPTGRLRLALSKYPVDEDEGRGFLVSFVPPESSTEPCGRSQGVEG